MASVLISQGNHLTDIALEEAAGAFATESNGRCGSVGGVGCKGGKRRIGMGRGVLIEGRKRQRVMGGDRGGGRGWRGG